jgi:hypothetical protein
MSDSRYTLAVRLTTAQKTIIKELAKASGRTMSALIHIALSEHVTMRAKRPWPASRRKAKAKPPAALPFVEKRTPEEHLQVWLSSLENVSDHPDQVVLDTWHRLLALYRVIRKGSPQKVSQYWFDMNRHRQAIEEGRELPVSASEQRVLYAFATYEALRKEWSRRVPTDRSKLDPQQLGTLRKAEAKRARESRARKKVARKTAGQRELELLQAKYCG